MSKVKKGFFCKNCGYESAKWAGKCPSCNEWNTFIEEIIHKESAATKQSWKETDGKNSRSIEINDVETNEKDRIISKDEELNRQLNFSASQTKNNALISNKLENDFTIRSEINGMIYSLSKTKGDAVGPQTPIAVIGDAKQFVLEMQVDEYDIMKIKKGLPVLITLDSYKKEVFNAVITKVNPLMNERSKTFLVEAEFVSQPNILYPNITFEASIIINTKKNAILIPRNYLLNDSIVMKANGEKIIVKTGLKDFQKIEILSGLKETDEISKSE